jgi:protein-S-isoprenylcysteine O-methyltransferase Ste14
MRALELKVPPLAVVVVTALLMWLVSRAAPAFRFEFAGRSAIFAVLVLAGMSITVAGVVSFRRAKTTVNPTKPKAASSLVVSGVYKFTRNPMYLGFLLALVGWGVFLSNALAFVPIAGYVVYLNRFQIEPEERALAALFGREFMEYRARVRRWI